MHHFCVVGSLIKETTGPHGGPLEEGASCFLVDGCVSPGAGSGVVNFSSHDLKSGKTPGGVDMKKKMPTYY